MKKRTVLSLLFSFLVAAGGVAAAQSRPQRPVLIRDTGVAEGKDTKKEEDKEKPYNPLLAEENLKVGNFYFKRKNYKAAIARFLEALQYQPNRIDTYEALGKAYEKNGEDAKALALYNDFIGKYPNSPKVDDFREKAEKLEKNLKKN